jgi:hypothetical protein
MPKRKLEDEAIANEARPPFPPIPPGIRPVPFDALLRKLNDTTDEAFADFDNITMVPVPTDLVPEVEALIAKRRTA